MPRTHSQPERYKTPVPSDNEMIVFLKIASPRELIIIEELKKGFNIKQIAERKIIFSESDRNKGKPVTTKTLYALIKDRTGYSSSSIRLYGMLERKKKKED